MAKHEITCRENKSVTADVAPFLGNYITKENIALMRLCDEASVLCGLPALQIFAIITGAFNTIADRMREAPVRFHTDLGTVCAIITGSFDSADAAFDPAKHSYEPSLRVDSEIANWLVDVVPVISAEGTLTKLRLDTVVDVELQRPPCVIRSNHPFRLQGFNMVSGGEDWSAVFETKQGVRYPITITTDTSKQLKVCQLNEYPVEGCDGKIIITSKAGDNEGPLQSSFRNVKYLAVEPLPTVIAQSQDGLVKVFTQGDKVNPVDGELHLDGDFRWKVTGEGFSGSARSVSDVKVIDPSGESLGLMYFDMSDDGKTLEIYNNSEDPIVLTPGRHEGYKIGLVTMNAAEEEEVVALPAVALVMGENA